MNEPEWCDSGWMRPDGSIRWDRHESHGLVCTAPPGQCGYYTVARGFWVEDAVCIDPLYPASPEFSTALLVWMDAIAAVMMAKLLDMNPPSWTACCKVPPVSDAL